MRLLPVFLLVLFSVVLTSCSTLPRSFTAENIMNVHQGMSSEKILSLFGKPKSIRSAICGRVPNQWKCTTWEYGKFPYDRAEFTFSGDHGSLKLNNYSIDRD